MNGLPYYKAYPRDFIEGTIGMPLELKGAYRVLLDLIYMQSGDLPDDPHYISGQLGCSVRKWKSIRERLIEAGKIQVNGDFLTASIVNAWEAQARKVDARPAIPTDIQRAVKDRDGSTCAYCGATEGPFHLDHIVPWSRGGKHSLENLTVACASCNWSKGDKALDEWRPVQ